MDRETLYGVMLERVGYRLPITRAIVCDDSEKKKLLSRIKKEWIENETRNKSCRKQQEAYMKCKSIRVQSGDYVYIDMNTGSPLDPLE